MAQVQKTRRGVTKCFIALGANLPSAVGTARQTIEAALRLLADDGISVLCQSRMYRTPAHPPGSGPDFVNAAAALRTGLSPADTLAVLHRIERALGRTRNHRWEARVIDIDLLAHADAVLPNIDVFQTWEALSPDDQQRIAPDHLILPHPRLHQRAFVLRPLVDIAGDWRHPVFNKTAAQLLAALPTEACAGIVALD